MKTETAYDWKVIEAVREGSVSEEGINILLEEYLQRFTQIIRHKSQRRYFGAYIKGLMSGSDRKSVEPVALAQLGEKAVRPMQELLKRSTINEEGLHAVHVEGVVGLAGGGGGMLSVDGSDFVKKGKHSAGVKRQYCGNLGKTGNCQAGVFVAYADDNGYGLVDKALYIPAEWFDEEHKEMRQKCQIPDSQEFQTKNRMAQAMLNKALKAGFNPEWIGMDAAFGCDHKLLDGLELPEGVNYFAATNAKERVYLEQPVVEPPSKNSRGRPRKHPFVHGEPICVRDVAQDDSFPWETVTLSEGSKGPIVADVKRIRCTACRASGGNRTHTIPGADIWLYIRRHEDGELKYYVSNAPEDTPTSELDRAATLRWPIEQCFQECKGFPGMAHYECRTLTGWNRHMLFVMIAQLFLRLLQLELKKTALLQPLPWQHH